MKSNICVVQKGGLGLENVLFEVEKITTYNEMPKKEALRLRLLAEELVGMLPELVKNFEGRFWVQNNEKRYELHVELSVENLSKSKKEELIAVSANKKNAAASGFMGKIRDIAENMLLFSDESSSNNVSSNGYLRDYAPDYIHDYDSVDVHYSYAWTLDHYTKQNKESLSGNDETWDQLEKSIVAKLADDVIVGVRGKKVEIIIKKEF